MTQQEIIGSHFLRLTWFRTLFKTGVVVRLVSEGLQGVFVV